MTYADTNQERWSRADFPPNCPPRGSTEEDEFVREILRQVGPSNPAPAISHYLREKGFSSASAVFTFDISFPDLVQWPANSAAIIVPSPPDTTGTLAASDLLQHVWTALTRLTEGRGESDLSISTEEQGTAQLTGPLDDFRRNLDEIRALGRDWDGHGAAPISGKACDYALKFVESLPLAIRRFEPFPEPDGSVGLEYHRGETFSLYLSFSPAGTLAYVAVFRGPEGEEEVHRGDGLKVAEGIPQRIKQFFGIDV